MNSFLLSNFKKVLNDATLEDKTAIKSGKNSLSYKALKRNVYKLSSLLQTKNYPNNLVGLMTGQEPEVYASIMGIISSGNAYVPINTSHPIDRIVSVIETAGLDTIVFVSPSKAMEGIKLQLPNINVIHLEELPDRHDIDIDASTYGDRLAYLLFTSGSTGKPKGVPIYLRNLDAYLKTLVHGKYGFNHEDQIMQMFELTFDFSIFPIFLNFTLGATLHVVPDTGLKPLKVFEILENEKITVAAMVPSVITYLKSFFHEISLPDIKINVFCGEALYDNILQGWAGVCKNAMQYNFYGPTEATVFCLDYLWNSETSPQEAVNGIVPIGRPMRGTQVCVINDRNELIDDTQKGELCLMGEQVTNKYWGDKEKTKASFIQLEIDGEPKTVYRTGDICYKNEKGDFIYCGRIDSQVKVDGFRIELSEIEHCLKECTQIDNVACIAIPNEKNNYTIYAFIESQKEIDVIPYLKQKLPHYMIPKNISFISKMPLNMNGKIDRPQLKQLV